MLTFEQENALQAIKEIGVEIDITNTIDTLRWAISNLASQARSSSSPDDVNVILDQIEVISDCTAWVCKIHDCSEELKRSDDKGGVSC